MSLGEGLNFRQVISREGIEPVGFALNGYWTDIVRRRGSSEDHRKAGNSDRWTPALELPIPSINGQALPKTEILHLTGAESYDPIQRVAVTWLFENLRRASHSNASPAWCIFVTLA